MANPQMVPTPGLLIQGTVCDLPHTAPWAPQTAPWAECRTSAFSCQPPLFWAHVAKGECQLSQPPQLQSTFSSL